MESALGLNFLIVVLVAITVTIPKQLLNEFTTQVTSEAQKGADQLDSPPAPLRGNGPANTLILGF